MSAPRWLSGLAASIIAIAACSQTTVDDPEASSGVQADAVTTVSSTSPAGVSTGSTAALTITVPDSTVATDPTIASTATTATTATSSTASSTSAPSTATTALDPAPAPIVIRLRLDRRVDDAATEGFAAFVQTVLTDERGWGRADFAFTFDDDASDYTVVLAEGSEVDSLCLPYDTYGRFSCQIGPVVALNADRWRTAVESWPASLDDYRTMLVNHEVGHLLGQHHPAVRCPGDGQPAPVMAQQSSGVAPCVANPWPLPWEITCALQRVEPLAPPFERNIKLTCGPDGPIG